MPFLGPALAPMVTALGGKAAAGAAAAAIGGSALSGVLGNRQSARTATQDATTQSRQNSTSRARRILFDEQQSAIGPLFNRATDMMTNPEAGLLPVYAQLRGNVNREYAAMPAAIADRYALSGGGRSGKKGRAARGAEMARLGALANLEGDFARMRFDRQDVGTSLAERLLAMNLGGVENTMEGTSSGMSSGSQIAPGSMLAGGVGGGVETLSALMAMQRLLSGWGGGGGGGDRLNV